MVCVSQNTPDRREAWPTHPRIFTNSPTTSIFYQSVGRLFEEVFSPFSQSVARLSADIIADAQRTSLCDFADGGDGRLSFVLTCD
jgi:hypothetical protein